jgi:hypothetical protein
MKPTCLNSKYTEMKAQKQAIFMAEVEQVSAGVVFKGLSIDVAHSYGNECGWRLLP